MASLTIWSDEKTRITVEWDKHDGYVVSIPYYTDREGISHPWRRYFTTKVAAIRAAKRYAKKEGSTR